MVSNDGVASRKFHILIERDVDNTMNNTDFNKVIEEQIKRSTDVLVAKNEEYASEKDRLHNFKLGAAYQQCTPKQACLGYLTKHLCSISDMVRSDKEYPIEVWNEKITDSINYLLLLRGLVEEDMRKNISPTFEVPYPFV